MKRPVLRLTFFYVACIALLVAICGAFYRKSLVLWPGDSVRPRIYTDAREGGFSTADFLDSDSAIAFSAVLNSGLYHPHAGIEFPLLLGMESLLLSGVDFSGLDSVAITFRASADIALVLSTRDPAVSRPGDALSYRPLRMEIPATRFYSEKRLPLSLLKPSELWLDLRGIEQDGNLYLDDVLLVSVETGRGSLLGLPTEIEIRKLEFFGTNRVLVRICLILLVLVTILYVRSVVKYGKKIANPENVERSVRKR